MKGSSSVGESGGLISHVSWVRVPLPLSPLNIDNGQIINLVVGMGEQCPQ